MIKKLLLIVILLAGVSKLYAQEHYIGVRGGITAGSMILQPFLETENKWGNKTFGISYKLIAGERWLGGFQTELSHVKTSVVLLPREESDSSYVRTMSMIEMPFFWHPYYDFGGDGRYRVFVNAGPYFYYLLDSEYEYIDNFDLNSDYNRKGNYNFNRYYDVRLGYGALGGAGFEAMINRRIQLSIEFRYKFAFSDVWKYAAKIDPNISEATPEEIEQMYGRSNYSQSQLTQLSVEFGLSYRFGYKRAEKNNLPPTTTGLPEGVISPPTTNKQKLTEDNEEIEEQQAPFSGNNSSLITKKHYLCKTKL